MKRKRFTTPEGEHYYTHTTGTDFFDVTQFPRRDKKMWREVLNIQGQNAERKAKSKCTTVFNHAMKLLFDELADNGGFILLGIYKMGYICRKVEETEKLCPETFNQIAKIKIVINHDFAKQIRKKYYVRLTRKGRGKLFNSVKVKKRGTVRKY